MADNNSSVALNACVLTIYIIFLILLVVAVWKKPMKDTYYRASFAVVTAVCLLRIIGCSIYFNVERH